MTPQTPVIDVLVARDGDGWRLYSAPRSWRTPLSPHADERGDVHPVGRPDIADLDRFMWETDSPFERRLTPDGGVEMVARGRSAVMLGQWLQGLIEASRRPTRRGSGATRIVAPA